MKVLLLLHDFLFSALVNSALDADRSGTGRQATNNWNKAHLFAYKICVNIQLKCHCQIYLTLPLFFLQSCVFINVTIVYFRFHSLWTWDDCMPLFPLILYSIKFIPPCFIYCSSYALDEVYCICCFLEKFVPNVLKVSCLAWWSV